MTTAIRVPADAWQNIRNQFRWQNFAWLAPEFEKLRRHWLLLLCLLTLSIFMQVIMDVDYDGHDVTANGIRIFTWLPVILGRPRPIITDSDFASNEIFPHGLNSLNPLSIKQRSLMDCKFLAAVSSFIRTDRGKKIVYQMIKQNADGSVTVTFPGLRGEAIVVEPLTRLEKHYYSQACAVDGEFAGQWLPILEKAYGTYRVDHQDSWKSIIRFLKHSILDGRFTDRPALMGFGASYGAADEIGAQVLAGGATSYIATSSFELGSFGLGKGHVTLKQLYSWLDRSGAKRSIEDDQDRALAQAMQRGSIVVASTEINGDAMNYHLFSGHAYAVLGYDRASRTLTLKDPLCADIWDPAIKKPRDGREDGLFQISLADFNLLFSRLRLQMNGLPN